MRQFDREPFRGLSENQIESRQYVSGILNTQGAMTSSSGENVTGTTVFYETEYTASARDDTYPLRYSGNFLRGRSTPNSDVEEQCPGLTIARLDLQMDLARSVR